MSTGRVNCATAPPSYVRESSRPLASVAVGHAEQNASHDEERHALLPLPRLPILIKEPCDGQM